MTVENTLYEDNDGSNTFKGFQSDQEEETYSMVTANRFWSQIFGIALQCYCRFLLLFQLWDFGLVLLVSLVLHLTFGAYDFVFQELRQKTLSSRRSTLRTSYSMKVSVTG